jgi:hypothetical protein
MKEKLSRIRSPWRRLILSLVIAGLVALSQTICLANRSPRSHIHWLGHAMRPRRLERVFFFVVMVVAMIALETRQYMIWAMLWGGGASLFVIVKTMYLLKAKPAQA